MAKLRDPCWHGFFQQATSCFLHKGASDPAFTACPLPEEPSTSNWLIGSSVHGEVSAPLPHRLEPLSPKLNLTCHIAREALQINNSHSHSTISKLGTVTGKNLLLAFLILYISELHHCYLKLSHTLQDFHANQDRPSP